MLEVCVDTIESAMEAVEGGAQRIELCSALSEGGLTPTVGLLKIVKEHVKRKSGIPIYVMLRPRRGNDFIYTKMEVDCILTDLALLRDNGADGFVFGALTEDREIDISTCKRVINESHGLPVTFHRAFDVTPKVRMYENCQLLEQLGFKRLLTSGFENTAERGIDNIRKLINFTKTMRILPGAGISAKNLKTILIETGAKEFHASARCEKTFDFMDSGISMGGDTDYQPVMITDRNIVRELIGIASHVELCE